MKRWKRWIWTVVIFGLAWAGLRFSGLYLDSTKAVHWPGQGNLHSDSLQVLLEEPTCYGKAVLFKDLEQGSFGVALLQRRLFIFWSNGGASYGNYLKPGEPLEATGYYSRKSCGRDQFLIGVQADPAIHYIATGSEDPDPNSPELEYSLTLAEVLQKPEVYRVSSLTEGYALFVEDWIDDQYASFSFRAFNADGQLVADYLVWNKRWLK